MEKVLEALQTGANALLESPTGTGKTMSLLCSTLAWRQAQEAQLGAMEVSNGSAAAIRIQYDLEQATGMSAYEKNPNSTDGQDWARRAPANRDRDGFQGFASGNVSANANSSNSPPPPPALQPRQHASKIIYTARTHSQLSQVVKELKATVYRPNVCILGSREQLCVHPKVSKEKGTKQNRACQTLVKDRKCRYHLGVEEYLGSLKISGNGGAPFGGKNNDDLPGSGANASAASISRFHVNNRQMRNRHSNSNSNSSDGPSGGRRGGRGGRGGRGRGNGGGGGGGGGGPGNHVIQDIEELHAFGKTQQICPYYLSRQTANADIYFMPYNYLVDPNVRQTLTDLQWKDAVVICDEAHNLEGVCEDASSFELKPEVIANSIAECDDCIYMLSSEQNEEGAIGGVWPQRYWVLDGPRF